MSEETNILSKAVVKYLSYDSSSFPKENRENLVNEFGQDVASKIEPKVLSVLKELDSIKPDWSKYDLAGACAAAKDEMQRKHPELDDAAIKTLIWAYSWWWR